MQTQNTLPDSPLNNNDTGKYTPSSSDKKRAVMMYLFLGIMIGLTKRNLNSFEYYHLKQAAGRWMIFLFVLVFDVVLLFIPVIKYIGLIPLILLLGLWVVNIKQSRDGKYFINKNDSPLALFSGVGGWLLDLFELGIDASRQGIDIDIAETKSKPISNIIQNDTHIADQSDIELDIDQNK